MLLVDFKSSQRRILKFVLAIGLCSSACAVVSESIAQTRNFQMAIMSLSGSNDTNLADVSWFNLNDPQPAAPRLTIMTSASYTPSEGELRAKTAQYNYDWSRIVAFEVDEPYLAGLGTSNIESTKEKMLATANAVRAISPTTRFWVNFSEPEILAIQAGVDLNQPYIDVISMDIYYKPFAYLENYYDWLADHPAKFHQQLALVPSTHYIEGAEDPNLVATYLLEYFDYATRENLKSDGWDSPRVWMVAGWFGHVASPDETYIPAGDPQAYRSILYPGSHRILEKWTQQFQKPFNYELGGSVTPIDVQISEWAPLLL